jgi:hypothetical protein
MHGTQKSPNVNFRASDNMSSDTTVAAKRKAERQTSKKSSV